MGVPNREVHKAHSLAQLRRAPEAKQQAVAATRKSADRDEGATQEAAAEPLQEGAEDTPRSAQCLAGNGASWVQCQSSSLVNRAGIIPEGIQIARRIEKCYHLRILSTVARRYAAYFHQKCCL